ncbi:MAG TPA: sigma-70 family RNA polymerase sigma factor [Solirubrobacterales bacterium]|nr:sigma-70 family RNA polymerase sigma factor [Solirubrobacterales bacterium]
MVPRLGGRTGERPQRRVADVGERRIAELLRSGDEGAIALVEARFGRVLGGFLREALPDRSMAEEVMQQVLVEIWRRGPDYDAERASLLTWMMTIARSRAIDERRRRRPEPIDPAAIDDGDAAPAAELDQMLERWRLAELLDQIPPEEAVALRLRFYDELAQPEISARLGVPLGTVKTRMVRGLARLRGLIAEEER